MMIRDIFSMAKVCKWTDAELNDRIVRKIWEPMNSRTPSGRKRFSEYMRGFAAGIVQSERDRIWREKVEFCYRDSDGVLFSTWKESVHRKTEEFFNAGRGSELGKMECAHVWVGTDKPFGPFSKWGAR